MNTETVKLSDVIFDEAIYPRKDHDPATVQRYAEDMEKIEEAGKFISISGNNKILDGKHRWLAYRKKYDGQLGKEIHVFRYPMTTEHEEFQVAVRLNSQHGRPLTQDDRQATAKKLFLYGYSQKTIAEELSVAPRTVSDWLARTIKEQKEVQKAKAFDMWMACHTQEEIAAVSGVDQATIARWADGFMQTAGNADCIKYTFSDGFDPPIYNIWKQQTKSNGTSHFGNSEQRWLENLLYLYTNPFDVVVDPFAGGGSTIDVCKKRGRRYFASDRKPIVERETEIRLHDMTSGLPAVPRWKDVRLVYLDPPYWKQAEGRYSNDPEDLANMELDQFTSSLSGIIHAFGSKIKGRIALIIQPTQWKAPGRKYVDHVGDMLRTVKYPVEMRFSVPYESQQCTAQMVEWGKENKTPLVLTREIIVWMVE